MIFRRHRWHGETGRAYRFRITMTDKGLPDGGGVYVFVRRRFVFWLQALYVGKAASFRSRLIGHERWHEAWYKKGATERHVLVLKDRNDHARIEEDLIRGLTPVMNDIHIPRGRKDAPNDGKLRRRWRRDRRAKPLFGLLG
ncbi:MAG: GIY-YIG nuclease family protein [Pseudomonadota bacterium]